MKEGHRREASKPPPGTDTIKEEEGEPRTPNVPESNARRERTRKGSQQQRPP